MPSPCPTSQWGPAEGSPFSPDPNLPNLSCLACMHAKSLQLCPTLGSRGLHPARLLCPWDSPGKNTGVGCGALLQRIFPIQGSNQHLLFPALAGRFFMTRATWEPLSCFISFQQEKPVLPTPDSSPSSSEKSLEAVLLPLPYAPPSAQGTSRVRAGGCLGEGQMKVKEAGGQRSPSAPKGSDEVLE